MYKTNKSNKFNKTKSINSYKKNLSNASNRDIDFDLSNQTKSFKNTINKYTMQLFNSDKPIILPQYVANFLEVSESILKSYINFESKLYNVENMAVDSITSNEILINLNGSTLSKCIITVVYNGIETMYYLTIINDTNKYTINKVNNEVNQNIIPNIKIVY